MNASLRKGHCIHVFILAPLLLGLYILALYVRHPFDAYVMEDALPPALQKKPDGNKRRLLLAKKEAHIHGKDVSLRFWKLGSEDWLSLQVEKTWEEPGLLLYWQEDGGQQLSPKAQLLGPLKMAEKTAWFALPYTQERHRKGVFLLYSLGHAKTLGSFHFR